MNFGLMRILIPIINGKIGKNTVFFDDPVLNDKTWDLVTLSHYRKDMQDKVFTPAGVKNATFEPVAGAQNALAYPFPYGNTKGWNSGDLSIVAAGAGWRLSTKELLNVMNHVRRKNTIINKKTAKYMLGNYFGIDRIFLRLAALCTTRTGRGQLVIVGENNVSLPFFLTKWN